MADRTGTGEVATPRGGLPGGRTDTRAHPRPVAPPFGTAYGLWYPLVWRALAFAVWLSPSRHLPTVSALGIDVYLGVCWVALGVLSSLSESREWTGSLPTATAAFVTWRLLDTAAVLGSMLLRGYYRSPGTWISANRIRLLLLANVAEVIFLFACLYRYSECSLGEDGRFSKVLGNLGTAVYYSVVTGTTLGYGDISPEGPLVKAMVVAEVIFVPLVVVVLFAYAAQVRPQPQDLEEIRHKRPGAGSGDSTGER